MNCRLLQKGLPAFVGLSALSVGFSGAAAAASLESMIRQAETGITQAGEPAAVKRAKVFAKNVCEGLTTGIQTTEAAKSFQDRYDAIQRQRSQMVAQVRQILEETPADDKGRNYAEEGIRRALLLQDAREKILKCLNQRRTQLGLAVPPSREHQPAPPSSTGLPDSDAVAKSCERYAELAISQQKQNVALQCGFIGSRWQDNYYGHYGWCTGADPTLVETETKIRGGHLKMCQGLSTRSSVAFCDSYAKEAQALQNDNLALGCDYEGGRWQFHYENHFNWCMRVPTAAVDKEAAARVKQMEACRKSKRSDASRHARASV